MWRIILRKQNKITAYIYKETHPGRHFQEETQSEMQDLGIHSSHQSNTIEQSQPQNL